jgi:hypothetical protein
MEEEGLSSKIEPLNGANGRRDIEGKTSRVGASECGQRASFKAFGAVPQAGERSMAGLFKSRLIKERDLNGSDRVKAALTRLV